jgi:phosphatidylethanolamine/phosphatidyl-N-methylethanolamine N-methyltransferase
LNLDTPEAESELLRGMTTKHIEHVYNQYAKVYDLIFGKVFQAGRERAPSLLEVFPGAKVLEVGVGTGLSIPYWCKNAAITGIDLSQKMLDQAEKRVAYLGLKNVELSKMDATQLQFADKSFDRVLAAYFISTVPDPVTVVQEMKRVCRPGGYLVFLNHFKSENPMMASVEKLISPLCYQVGFRTDLGLNELMESAGLEIEVREKIDFFGLWTAVRCINP